MVSFCWATSFTRSWLLFLFRLRFQWVLYLLSVAIEEIEELASESVGMLESEDDS